MSTHQCPNCPDGQVTGTYDRETHKSTYVCDHCHKIWNTNVAWLMDYYKGLRVEDLAEGNECYSCVICSKQSTCLERKENKNRVACMYHETCTLEQFVLYYDFSLT